MGYFDGIENGVDFKAWLTGIYYNILSTFSPDRYEKASKSHELKGLPVNLLLGVAIQLHWNFYFFSKSSASKLGL